VDIAITSVADNGSGKARFTTATSHNLIVGRPTVISGFVTETTYNRTVIVTAVDTPLTGTTFDVEDITFIATDTGNVNNASLDQTSELVIADKSSSPDSMFTASVGLDETTTPITVTITGVGVATVIDSVNWTYTNLERFTVSTNDEGEVSADDPEVRKYRISYDGTINRGAGGGGTNIGIVLLKNGVNVSFNPPHRTDTGFGFMTGEDIIELTDPNSMKVGVINYLTGADIEVSQINMVVSLA